MKNKRGLDGKPRKAQTQQNCEAWFYADKRSCISVFIRRVPDGPTVTCRISRRALMNWIENAHMPHPLR